MLDWFIAIWWVAIQKNWASAKGLQRVLGLESYQTAWTWLHKIRKAMIFPNRAKLSGVAEVDETHIGSEEQDGKRGRGTENKLLFVLAVELKDKGAIGRIRMSVTPDASGNSLKKFITASVEKGSNVTTYGWTGYSFLEKEGYGHTVFVQKQANDI
ncbi:MAG: IS1595 family transposase [Clostridiales bacterium]|nr:IS1595 family transposase [Clostridiales bacterium]